MAPKTAVSILYLEDRQDDVALVQHALERGGIDAQLQVATTQREFIRAIQRCEVELIVSDSGLPDCNGIAALELSRRIRPQIPFIFVCSSLEMERTATRFKALGAADCIVKRRLEHLAPAVRYALHRHRHVQAQLADPWHACAMEYLVTVLQELSLARDLDGIMTIVRRAARELTGADGATFVLREGDMCFYAEEDAISPLWKGQRFPMRTCVSGWVMMNREAAVIEDIYADPRVPVDAYRPTFVKSLAMVPIRTVSPIGAIGNYWASRHLATEQEVKALQALADSTSVAMENVQLYAGLEQRVHDRT